MSEQNQQSFTTTYSQRERWIKYGANVILSSVLVAALAVVLTIIAQAHTIRVDTTIGSSQSLRPQTLNYIQNDLKSPVRIIGLYPKIKSESHEQDFYQPVADLLNDYATKGHNITVQMIDPDTQKDDFNKLVAEVTNRFGGEVKGYKAVLNALPADSDIMRKFATDEAALYRQLPGDQVQDPNLQQALYIAYPTLLSIPKELTRLSDAVDADVNQQIPSYKEAVEEIRTSFTNLSQAVDLFSGLLDQVKSAQNVPQGIVDYAPAAQARAAAAKKTLTEMLDRIGKLGELKELDDFRDQLRSKSIIVITDSGYKILQFDQVWKIPESSEFGGADSDVQQRLTFAGEQQISAAILALTVSKPMVVFVRTSGPPITGEMGAGHEATFSAIAQRLRDYNFEVRDKDASGSSAMLGNDPTDDEMKSAVWVIVRDPQNAMPESEAPINAMLEKHLREGGAAMVMLFPTSDATTGSLRPMGIDVDTDAVIVHEALPATGRRSTDMVDAALQDSQLFYELNNYGDHPIAQPLAGLDFVNAASSPVYIDSQPPAGVTVTPLLPIPQTPHSWAASGAMTVLQQSEGHKLDFNPKADPGGGRMNGDVDNTPDHPLYGAAAAQSANGARVVVVGSYWFASSEPVSLPDIDMLEKHGVTVARLPGNGEFFVNSIFWLSHMEDMLAISPHALQVARIREMSPGALRFWRAGVLTAGLPLAVIVAGLMVYVRRRD
jgi:hypothetical protein